MRKVRIKKLLSGMLCAMVILTTSQAAYARDFYETGTPKGYEREFMNNSVSFIVPESLLNGIKQIPKFTDDCDYQTTYLVSNSSYYVVSNNDILIGVVKATGSLPDTIEDYASIMAQVGIRVDLGNAKVETQTTKDVTKIIADEVACMSVLSTEYYNDYVGDVAFVRGKTSCYGMFFGTLAGASVGKDVAKIIDTSIKSLILEEGEAAEAQDDPETNLLLGVVTDAAYRLSNGEVSDIKLQVKKSLYGEEALDAIEKALPESLFTQIPALSDGNEWIYVEISSNKDMNGQVGFHYSLTTDENNLERLCILDDAGTEAKMFFQVPEGVECYVAAGEKCTGYTYLTCFDERQAYVPEESISIEPVSESVSEKAVEETETQEETKEQKETETDKAEETEEAEDTQTWQVSSVQETEVETAGTADNAQKARSAEGEEGQENTIDFESVSSIIQSYTSHAGSGDVAGGAEGTQEDMGSGNVEHEGDDADTASSLIDWGE